SELEAHAALEAGSIAAHEVPQAHGDELRDVPEAAESEDSVIGIDVHVGHIRAEFEVAADEVAYADQQRIAVLAVRAEAGECPLALHLGMLEGGPEVHVGLGTDAEAVAQA